MYHSVVLFVRHLLFEELRRVGSPQLDSALWRVFCHNLPQIELYKSEMSETSGAEKVEVNEEEYNTPVTTRTGDKGTSSLYNGKRLPKSDIHFEALGSLDELNSQIGVAREFLCSDCAELDDYLEKIQCLLFSVCSAVATPLKTSSQYVLKKIHFDEAHVKNLEKWSALIYSQLPPQDSFYLPVLLVHSRDI